MKRKSLLLFAISWLFINALTAQNPFKEYGYEVGVITLSKGKYIEFIPNDSIHRIGTVKIDTRTGEIVELIYTDNIEVGYNYKTFVASRWISPDPLSEEYPKWSPYNYTLNNPIRFIDPDGREVKGFSIDDKGNVVVGKKASKSAITVYNAMGKTKTGTAAFKSMVQTSTKVKLQLTSEAVYDESGNQIHGYTDGSGNEDGLYKKATIVISTAEIEGNTNDRYNGFGDEEKINGIGTHEEKHLQKEQIETDNKMKAGEIDIVTSEQEPVKQEYESRKEYRKEYGKEGERDIKSNYEGFIKK